MTNEYKNIFDTHAHYDDEDYDDDLDEILKTQEKNGVNLILNAGSSIESSKKSVYLSKEYDFMYCGVGVHPHDAKNVDKSSFCDTLEDLAKFNKVVAIGEIGLDYHYNLSDEETQRQVFLMQLNLAKKLNLPVIIHSREATVDMKNILNKHEIKGVVHCFTGSKETAKEHLEKGLFLGFTGIVTFKNAKKVLEAIKVTPLDKILLETDCPYMAPVPHRGKRNLSEYIKLTAQVISSIKGIKTQELIDIANENGKALFGIK